MAKGKRAAALFEVIQAAKQKEQLRASGGGFLTPSWWFKGKARNGAAQPAPSEAPPPPTPAAEPKKKRFFQRPAPAPAASAPAENSADVSASIASALFGGQTPSSPESSPASSSDAESTIDEPTQPLIAPAPMQDVVDNEVPAMDDPADEKPTPTPLMKPIVTKTRPAPASSDSSAVRRPVNLGVDRLRQQISLRLSFTSAAISSFALLVIVGLAFLIGRSAGHSPASAGAASIEQIKSGPAFPDVLRVPQKSTTDSQPPAQKSTSRPPAPAPAQASKNAAPQAQAQNTTKPPASGAPVAANGKRIVGTQYVVVQSYPDPEDANDAAKALNDAGVAVTVEKIPWYSASWYCVVGTRGFDHTKNNNDYTTYINSIQAVSNAFAGVSKFKRFEPRAIGWRDTSH